MSTRNDVGAARVLVLSGAGRYADPWHPYPATSARIEEILRTAGHDAEIATDVDAALAGLATAEAPELPDLVIANLGRPDELPDGATEPGAAGLDRLVREVPVLALHAAANCFPESDAWEERIGGRWIPGTSGHPPFGTAEIRRSGELAGVTEGIERFEIEDERYVDLRLGQGRRVLYEHDHPDGGAAPSIWVTGGADGVPRTAYDALGHDERSYDSAEHRELLVRIVSWLLER